MTSASRHSNIVRQLADRAAALYQAGKLPEAAEVFTRAVSLAPKNAVLQHNLSVTLRRLGRIDAAIDPARLAVSLNPDYTAAAENLVGILQQSGRPTEALAALAAAVRRHPAHFEFHLALGIAYSEAGRHAEAHSAFRRAADLNPRSAPALFGLGIACQEQGQLAAARDAYERGLSLDPSQSVAWTNLGVCLLLENRHTDAITPFRRALQQSPNDAKAALNLGICLLKCGEPAEAEAVLRKLLESSPLHSVAWSNLGSVLLRQQRAAEAETAIRRAIALDPKAPHAFNNLGSALAAQGQIPAAIDAFRTAVSLDPNDSDAANNAAMMELLSGDFDHGWDHYEARLAARSPAEQQRFHSHRRWTSDLPVEGRTLLIHAEQGLGDTVQFARYIPMLASRGARVVFEVQRSAKPLLESFAPFATVVAQGEPLPHFDLYCPLLSLPREFATRCDSIPPPFRCTLPANLVAHWGKRLACEPRMPRVGVVWNGSAKHSNDANRSIPIDQFRTVFAALPEVQFFSLQKNPPPADVDAIKTIPNLQNVGPEFTDFADTAAAIEHLDCVVSVDTSVAHVSATQNKPTLILLPFVPDWRWQLDRPDSPWYPSATLLRQPAHGDWSTVLREVIARLRTTTQA